MGLTQKLGTIPLAIFTDASNNVGIGGSPSGSFKLDVTGTGRFTSGITGANLSLSDTVAITLSATDSRVLGGSSTGRLLLANSGTSTYGIFYGASHATAPNAISLVTDNTERLRITNTGNVGIGTTSPGRKLSVQSTSTAIFAYNNTNAAGQYCNIWQLGGAETNATSSYYLYCDTDNVGIRMVIYGNGNLANVNGSYGTYSSDIRLKENIVPATSKLNDLMSLNVVNYNFKNDEKKNKQIGFIAQEFKEVFPSLVYERDTRKYDEQGNVIDGLEDALGLGVGMEFAIIVKAIQEQQELIQELSAKVSALENKS
jgi:hypothetical protein